MKLKPHLALALPLVFTTALARAAEPAWIEASNGHAETLLELRAEYLPEWASAMGVEGYDGAVLDLGPRFRARREADLEAAASSLRAARDEARNARVRQDLDILIMAAEDEARSLALQRRLMLPYLDLPQTIFQGIRVLLDDRVAPERQQAALDRLRRYVGAQADVTPVTALARARFEAHAADDTLTGPWRVEVEQHLENQSRYVEGIRALLEARELDGWEQDFETLVAQLDAHAQWVREVVLPRSRDSHRLPPELYADNLKSYGVHADPKQLMQDALASYQQTRAELAALARLVAEQRELESDDYRDVIRTLKMQRIPNDRLLEVYSERLTQIEAVVREHNIVSVPRRDAVIRLATEAESASTPAPHVLPPRLIGNTGEPAEFVLPLENPNAAGAEMDDFNFDAITWTLTAHEARPGHELQFAAMIEQGVSIPRAVFAFNSANVEGWALYAEALMKRHLPLEGQIGTLQLRLLRAARAFLDPMLNLGMMTPDAAQQFLMREVVLSEPMAKQEVDRYTFRAPGQATAYFYGSAKLHALRTRAELALRESFDERAYHDFILSQGLLPLDLLAQAVMERFVAEQRPSTSP